MNPFLYVLTTNGLLFILSIIFSKFPPKKINNLYGYRSHRSMLNQDIWDFSNTVFNKEFIKYSVISFAVAILFAFYFGEKTSWQPMILVLLTIIVTVMKTEKAITNTFTEEGKRKKK
jgi:uncharacterized membrane protein